MHTFKTVWTFKICDCKTDSVGEKTRLQNAAAGVVQFEMSNDHDGNNNCTNE